MTIIKLWSEFSDIPPKSEYFLNFIQGATGRSRNRRCFIPVNGAAQSCSLDQVGEHFAALENKKDFSALSTNQTIQTRFLRICQITLFTFFSARASSERKGLNVPSRLKGKDSKSMANWRAKRPSYPQESITVLDQVPSAAQMFKQTAVALTLDLTQLMMFPCFSHLDVSPLNR